MGCLHHSTHPHHYLIYEMRLFYSKTACSDQTECSFLLVFVLCCESVFYIFSEKIMVMMVVANPIHFTWQLYWNWNKSKKWNYLNSYFKDVTFRTPPTTIPTIFSSSSTLFCCHGRQKNCTWHALLFFSPEQKVATAIIVVMVLPSPPYLCLFSSPFLTFVM